MRPRGTPRGTPCDLLHAAAGSAICYTKTVPAVQADVAALPSEQALRAQVPAEQSRSAVVPAVQSCVTPTPATQSDIPGRTQVPTVQVPISPHGTPPTTALPTPQTPDPLARPPKGTRTGDSYFDFPLAFWSDIWTPPFANCIYLAILKQLHHAFSIGQFKNKIYANSVDHFHLISLPPLHLK